MAGDRPTRIEIDVVSDVVCPWCFVGKQRLDAALASLEDVDVHVNWRPFQLDPTIPAGGMSRHDYMSRKFGPEKIAEIHGRLEQIGKEAGIPFAFDKVERSPNTLDAHRVIRWAAGSGKQTEVVERLFQLYFVEGGDIGNRDILAGVAEIAGLDRDEIRARLETPLDISSVQDEIATAVRLGVSGVPFFILGGKYGVSGAQSSDVLLQAIERAMAPETGLA